MSENWTKKLSWVSIIVIVSMLGALFLPDYQMAFATEKKKPTKTELAELRTEYSKTYKKGEEYILEEYLEPIHVKKHGQWLEIDNTIQSVSREEALDEELPLENKENAYRIGFAKNSKAKKLVRFQLNDAYVDFGLVDGKAVQADYGENRVSYPSVYPDVDLVYHTGNTGVKEEWVLHSYDGNRQTFTMSINTKGVEAKPQRDGSIHFVNDKGNVAFTIPRPYMVDANLRYSDNLRFAIRKEGGRTFLDLHLDTEWLQDSERAYPVRVDPSLEIQGKFKTYDSFVGNKTSERDKNFQLTSYLTVGNNPDHGISRSFIKFALEPLLSSATIQSAKFSIYQVNADTTPERENLHPVTQDWSSATVTWNNQPTVGAAISNQTVGGPGWYDFFLTDLARQWYSGETPNYGISLRHATESNNRKSYWSSDYTNHDLRPKLTIVYTIDPIGEESFWTSVLSDVNTFNGNLVITETDTTVPGRGIEATIDRTYNSRSDAVGIFGHGWIASIEQRIQDSGDGPILYTDGDGTPHTFASNGDGSYEAPGGVYLELVKQPNGTYVMLDKDQTEFTFNTAGRLTKITDTNGNTTTIGYTNGRPTSITDASGRRIALTYSGNQVSKTTDPANRTVEYAYDGNGNLTAVTKKDSSGKTLSTVGYGYDGEHNLTTITDPNGNEKTITYNRNEDRVTRISYPLTIKGQVETATYTFAYDTTNRVTTATDPKGKKTVYQHNEFGNVIETVEDADGLQLKHTYEYDGRNELISEKDANANARGTDDTYTYTYDANGNLTSVTNPLQETERVVYDDKNNPVKETDANGNTTIYEYDQNNNETSTTDALEKSSAQKHDAYGNVIEETTAMSPGVNLAINGSFEIDRNSDSWPDDWYRYPSGTTAASWVTPGLVTEGITLGKRSIKITDPAAATFVSNSKRVPYDPEKTYFFSGYARTNNAQGVARIDAVGYQADGTTITKSIPSSGLSGTQGPTRLHVALEPGAFPEGTTQMRIRAYVAGKNGQYGGEYWFDGLQIEEGFYGGYNLVENSGFERDNDPQDTVPDRWFMSPETEDVDGVTTAEKHTGQMSGKLVGRDTLWKSYYQDIQVSGSAGATFTVSGFSKVLNPRPTTNGVYGYIIKTYQGSTERETFTYKFDSSKSHDWEHQAAQVKTTQSFDRIRVFYQFSQMRGTAWFDTAKVVPGSLHTRHAYDERGNYEVKTVNPEGKTTETTYDILGNILEEKDGTQVTRSEYDGANRLTKVTDPLNNRSTYEYDPYGNKTKVTNARNASSTFQYNEINKVKEAKDALGRVTTFEYDLVGNETEVTDPNGHVVAYTYDAVDRKTSISHNGEKQFSFEYDPNGNVTKETDHARDRSTSFTYDKDDKLKTETETGGITTEYTYDKNGNTTQRKHTAGGTTLTQGFVYNAVDELIRVTENGQSRAWFTYDEADRTASRKTADGSVTLYRYNGAGDLIQQIVTDPSGELRDTFTHTYDSKGNRTRVVSSAGTTLYAYDELEQLIKETHPDGTVIEYTYDEVGNRTSKKITKDNDTTTSNYSYDLANQLTHINDTSVTHDDNGNLTGDGKRTFVYDAEDRLIEVKDEDGATLASFTYRADGMRKTMTTAAGTIRFHYDENKNVIHETDESNRIVAHYTYGLSNQPISMTRDGKTYYYQLNGHGDVAALTDANGQVVATYAYDAWGNIIAETGNIENPYRYLGYRYDAITGLYYLQARYYDPDLGRFLTLDPDEGDEEEAITQNGYAYANNNPVMLADPDGEWVWLAVNAGFAAYDGYKAYKKYKKQGKRGAALWGRVAWAAGSNFLKVGKVAKVFRFAKGRTGKQAKLRQLAKDPKVSRSLRGEIKRDINLINKKKRKTIRVPQGYHLAHRRGFEARKGYGYKYSHLQMIKNHKLQHKHDNNGKKRRRR